MVLRGFEVGEQARHGQTLKGLIGSVGDFHHITNVVSRTGVSVKMAVAMVKPAITKELLDQIDIRAGTIVSVDDVAGSDKLVALRVNFGDHERTIVAGLKQERADPREIVGKQALFVVNLEPRKMRGVLSEGMLFDLGYADGITPVLAMPERPVPDGTRAG